MTGFAIETKRLVLREWRRSDVVDLLGLRSDPRVMATLGPLQTEQECLETFERQTDHQRAHGFCFWALEAKDSGRFIGTCGLVRAGDHLPFAGQIEIGWQLAFDQWGHGFASEAAMASLDWGFAELAVDTIFAITSTGNVRSRAVMERLGMHYISGADFDHPKVAPGSALLRHVTYAISRPAWEAK
ncbi:MAG: GNAT family N-acetyltransferase [Novosphingobium sp.]